MLANVMKNPDTRYFKNKEKRIKSNGGYCLDCPKTEDWKCPCKIFREMEEGWCPEVMYYKSREGEDNE